MAWDAGWPDVGAGGLRGADRALSSSASAQEAPRLRTESGARWPEQLADRYLVEREIGRGASAVVFLARDLKLDRPVAIKVIRPELASSISAERFLREVRVTAQLGHPHVLPLHDSGEADGLLYYVMPYVEGESLRQLILRERRLPVAQAVRLAREVADALHHAHARRLVHRDVKPENILLQDGHALVADFGIVRALDQAEDPHHRLTTDGFSPGTPAYMSPEQGAGDEPVDARSDQYSLASVLYEMLSGRPPFEGPSPHAIMARRLVDSPEPVATLRPDTPPHVSAAVDRALATTPDERFATVADFAAALEAPRARASAAREVHGRRGRREALAAALIAVAAIAVVALWRPGAGPARAAAHDPVLDTALYAVIPFHSGDGTLGARAALHLYDALAEWDGLRLVRTLGVNDAMAREGGSAALGGPDAARRVARALGAGRAVFGNVSPDGDSLRVDAVVYDAASGRGLQSAKASVGPDLAGAADAFAALARQLLASVPGGPPPATAAGGTRSLPAWRAYERGHLALRDWDVDAAADAFAEAAAADPEFARAQLWLAQSSAWRNGAPGDSRVSTEERAAATRAAGLAGRLPKRDRALAAALLALAERRFPQACEGFRSLVAADSLDFAGWYGLGLCQWRDDAVVRSTRSRSGWAFRSSFHGAAAALLRAMRVAPSFQRAFRGTAAERLGGVLVTDAGVLREGHGPAREVFYAYPGFEGDTLVYVPWPVRAFAEGRRETVPASYGIALERNRRAVRTILSDWARAFPRSLPAQVALAHALEATGEIRDARGGDPSALEAYGRALALAAEPRSRVALAQDVARIHLKRGEHARARALADSLLRAWPDSLLRDHPQRANIVDRLAGLAVLTGRGRRAAAMRAMAAAADTVFTSRGERVLLPPELAADAARLRVFSSLGAPADSIRTIAARVEARLRSSVEAERRDAMREAALTRSLSFAVSAIGLGTVRGLDGDADILVRMQQALERGDTAALRRTLGDVDGARRALPPGTVPIDATFHEAWLLLAAGDTAAAVRRLDGSLGALSALGPWVTVHVSEAAALVRAMALRADLAALAGDAATARQWATPVTTLWADADPELQPLVARMRALAR